MPNSMFGTDAPPWHGSTAALAAHKRVKFSWRFNVNIISRALNEISDLNQNRSKLIIKPKCITLLLAVLIIVKPIPSFAGGTGAAVIGGPFITVAFIIVAIFLLMTFMES